jgi:membrane protein
MNWEVMRSSIPLARSRPVRLLIETVSLWSSHQAFEHAAALAFYTLFSMAPLLIILVTIVGAAFGEEAARGEIASYVGRLIGPDAAELVEGAVLRSRIEEAGLMPTILGIAALLFGSTTVFAQMQAALNDIWGVAAKPTRSGLAVFVMTRIESLGLVLVIGFIMLTSFVISTAARATIAFAEGRLPVPAAAVAALDLLSSLLVATLLFAMIFKILPDVRLQWRDMWLGAVFTAVLFVLGQSLIAFYLAQTAPASVYGAAGALVLLLLWVYYSSLILFFGASMTRAVIRLRGERIVPKPTAVRVRRQVLEEQPGGRLATTREID